MKIDEIRESYLSYFERSGHRRVASSSLVPAEDPSLLFTNAGMVQFKSVFTGGERRDYSRATSSQRCVRAGGKHNDLENVGFTARHHTFFEMLGNFSFGDYFKDEAIQFAYELLVKEWGLDPDRLVYTYFEGDGEIRADIEARALWKSIAGVSDDRVLGMGLADNFWAMGDTGPCGPCSEIHFHLGDHVACTAEAAGGRCEGPRCDCDRWIEIWNLVFMQYERRPGGELVPLPKPSIDTGLGLERVAAILQGKESNYEIDLFRTLIGDISDLTGARYGESAEKDVSLRVIADHIRAGAFLIADGVYPSNEGRGYVLRRILRRMIRHGRLLGARDAVLHRLVPRVGLLMGKEHPVITERERIAANAIRREEETFLATIDRGMALLDEELDSVMNGVLPGATVFRLYDTFGFPPDLTAIIAAARNVAIDQTGFDAAMAEQKERSRKASKFAAGKGLELRTTEPTDFLGYEEIECEASILEIAAVDSSRGEYGVILDRTVFYAESGGQIGDAGVLRSKTAVFRVANTIKNALAVHAHVGSWEGEGRFAVGDKITVAVDRDRRVATERNHTATHLLHAALFETLGDHVQQAGSYVGPDRLRFDYNHTEALTPDQMRCVERKANRAVIWDATVATRIHGIEEARKLGAKAFFGEKYGELVRVVTVEADPPYSSGPRPLVISREFCGGSHVRRCGEIGLIKITSESAIASGVRRLEATTGHAAISWIEETERNFSEACRTLSSPASDFPVKLAKLVEERKRLEKELKKARLAAILSESKSLAESARLVSGVPTLAACIDDLDQNLLREVSDTLMANLGEGVVILGSNPGAEGEKKAAFCVRVAKGLTSRIKAGDVVGRLASVCGGGGGGRADVAQAGGKDPSRVKGAIESAHEIVRELLEAP